ncbi:MAG: hypothetical protein JOZ96_14020 [Acidobacteria bacterium]|nr:hypothetical protein [Acidobacteriota bacterium]
MGTTGKQQLTQQQRQAAARSSQPPQQQEKPLDTRALRADTFEASKAYLRHVTRERPYAKLAFANPYNLSLLGGGLLAAGLTLSPLLAIVVICLEILWLVYSPGSKALRRLLWDPQFDNQERLEAESARAARLQVLDASDRERVNNLVARQQEINQLAGQNPSFTGELLRTELAKTDRLVESFIDMAVTCARYEQYLESVNLAAVEHDRGRWERIAQRGEAGDPQAEIARKNLGVIMKRLDKLKEIQRYLMVARGQLDLIENSFQLIADQIVTMQSPQELTGQLDELIDGVESIKQTAADTERLLNPLGAREFEL